MESSLISYLLPIINFNLHLLETGRRNNQNKRKYFPLKTHYIIIIMINDQSYYSKVLRNT